MKWLAAKALALLSVSCVCVCASKAYLQYGSTPLSGSLPNVTLTVYSNARVYCLQATGSVPTSMEWYNPQGQLVSRNGGNEVNQASGRGGRIAILNFQSYRQSQGGKYECRVTVPGKTLEKLPVLISPRAIPPHPSDTAVSAVALTEAGKVRVAWSRPALGPEEVITGYSVQYRRRGTTSYTTHSVSGSGTTSYTITNLKLGTVYEVRVASLGPPGQSQYCCGSGKQVTTYDYNPRLSDSDVSVVAVDEAGKVRVTWRRPPLGPGQVITGYSVQYRRRGTTSYTTHPVSGSSTTSYTITNLNLGAVYEVRVASVGPLGLSAYCCGSGKEVMTYKNNPYPSDDGVSVLALDEAGKITVTWQRPPLGPGQVITGYSVQYRRRGTFSYSTRSVSGSGTTSYTITNLDLGTVYEVRVASVGPLGVSGYCCGSGKQVTTYNWSNPPTAVAAVSGVNLGSIRVTWVAPSDTGGLSIAGYSLQYRIRGSTSFATQLSQPQPTEATITGLRLGTTYQVRVATVTAIGIGPYCCTQNGDEVFARTRDVPAKVSGVSAVPGVSSGRPTIRVTWSAPQSDEPISKYHLQYRKATASDWTAVTLAPSETSTVLSGLDRGTVYHVQVRAISVVGSGPFSDRQQVTTHNVPSLISALSVSPTESAHRPALSVSWSPPQSDLPILHYTVSYSLRDSGAVTNITTTGTRVLIINLSIGATYQVAVTARSALGEGPRSVWVHQTTFSHKYCHVNLHMCN